MSISLSCCASQESKTIPKIGHPLKTSSCGMFSLAAHRYKKSWLAHRAKACEPYKKADGGRRTRPESVKSSHIGEDLDGVDVSLLLSLRQRK